MAFYKDDTRQEWKKRKKAKNQELLKKMSQLLLQMNKVNFFSNWLI